MREKNGFPREAVFLMYSVYFLGLIAWGLMPAGMGHL